MIVDQIEEGIVLDHITAGNSNQIYNVLGLDKLDCTVATIQNADSVKMGKKDIIKIGKLIDIDLTILGYIDPGITVSIINGGKIVKRVKLTLPETVTDIIKCKNPRCITSCEQELRQEFRLVDRENKIYRCVYCESKAPKHIQRKGK